MKISNLLAFAAAAVLLVLVILIAPACGSSSPAMSLTDIRMCSNPEGNGDCSSDSSSFSTGDAGISLSGTLDAPSGTVVTAVWRYVRGERGDQPQEIDRVNATASTDGQVPYTTSLQSATNGWPAGDYEVELTLSADSTATMTRQFSIS